MKRTVSGHIAGIIAPLAAERLSATRVGLSGSAQDSMKLSARPIPIRARQAAVLLKARTKEEAIVSRSDKPILLVTGADQRAARPPTSSAGDHISNSNSFPMTPEPYIIFHRTEKRGVG